MSTSGNGGGSSMRSRRSQLSSRNSATLRMWSRRACAASRISNDGSSAGSSSRSSRVLRHRSSNDSNDETSSCTSIRGGSPDSIGNAVRIRCANECKVHIAASSSASRAQVARSRTTGSPSSRARVLQLRAHPVAQLRRGLLRERDRGNGAHRHRETRTVGRHAAPRSARRGPWSCRCPRPPRRTASRRGATARPRARRGHRSAARSSFADQLEVLAQLRRGALPQPGAVRVDGAQLVGIAVFALGEELEAGLARPEREVARRRSRSTITPNASLSACSTSASTV